MTLRISSLRPFLYIGWNAVRVKLNGVNISRAVAEILNAYDKDDSVSPLCISQEGDCFFIEGAESYGLEDLAESIEGILEGNTVEIYNNETKVDPEN